MCFLTKIRFLVSLFFHIFLASLFIGWSPEVSSCVEGEKTDSVKRVIPAKEIIKDKIVHQGAEVEFSIEPLSLNEIREGEFATLQFQVRDSATGAPIPTLRPSVWLDLQKEMKGMTDLSCKEKIGRSLQGSLGYRPDIDLNSYFILSLNNDATISVTDPIISLRGITQLYTMIYLKRPGEDWALTRDEKRLFVTMPKANQVAVVDMETFKLVNNIEAGSMPFRIALQPDGKYLWVGNDAPEREQSGVTVIDSGDFKVVAQILTGAGHHEIAFTDDSLHAFVTNEKEGTLSIIDIQGLKKVKDIATGDGPVAMAFSPLSRFVYVAHRDDGVVAVIDSAEHEVVSRIRLKPGLRALRFAPGGRWGFVANAKENRVYVFDASNNRLIHDVEVGKEPDQIAFTAGYAYVRSKGSPDVVLIQLLAIGKEGTLPLVKISGGQVAPGDSPYQSIADAIVPTPEPGHVLIANPSDKMIYYYMEGMQFPMGSFRSYGGYAQRAVRVIDRSLREKERGVYTTKVKIPASGKYQVAFLLDTPRILHCFEFTARPNPLLAKKEDQWPRIEFMTEERRVKVGEGFTLRFKLLRPSENESIRNVKDMTVQATLAPGTWNGRYPAKDDGNGVYEVTFTAPQGGVYYVTFSCPSLKLNPKQLPSLVLYAGVDETRK